MMDCDALRERMPDVVGGRDRWIPAEAEHLAQCRQCADEWRVVRAGFALHEDLSVDVDAIAARVISRLRHAPPEVRPLPLRWREFAFGFAAAASIALAVWLPNGTPAAVIAVRLPASIGPSIPTLSTLTDEQLDRVATITEPTTARGVPGSVPHLGDLSSSELDQLSRLTESP